MKRFQKRKEAQQILDKIEFHYTSKHGSWLNMSGIEINIMNREYISGRIGSSAKLKKEVTAWVKQQNKNRKKIHWTFTRQDAYAKLSKYCAL